MKAPGRLALALLAAVAAFALAALAIVAASPWVFGALVGCVPPEGSCGDSAGWAMLISLPVSLPLALLASGFAALWAFVRVRGR